MTFQDMMAAVQAVILFLGLGATVYTLRFNRKDSMRRSTLDLIIHQRSDEDLNKAMSKVNDLISEKGVYEDLSSYFQNRHSEEAQAILKVLNFREFVAVGINLRVIDEDIYKRAYCSLVLRDWKNLENTVKGMRTEYKKDTLFQDFEMLAKQWADYPIKDLHKKSGVRRLFRL
ncbi:DUF4760 domain-containing protein [uncultured Succinivibrio sp.]|uniref:DUF4760 domain-containing protein n=1 Tax=uncultured Succinivibrio sp. TaxID=540749 RepID=UPI0025D23961|nr:DUF4760 domain-containing protein [uncultured Succinivibrio sp.]